MKGNKYNIKNLLHLYAKMFSVQASEVFSCRAACNPPPGLCSEADVRFGQRVDETKGVQDLTGAMKTADSSKRIAVLREHVAILERNTAAKTPQWSRWAPEGAVRPVPAPALPLPAAG